MKTLAFLCLVIVFLSIESPAQKMDKKDHEAIMKKIEQLNEQEGNFTNAQSYLR